MGKKIIDEFTSRTDLSAFQKFKLRNPERYRAMQTEATKRWRNRHPLEYMAKYEKDNAKCTAKRAIARLANKHARVSQELRITTGARGKISAGRRDEILRLFEKGKDIGSICVWTNTPVSAVKEIIASHSHPAV